MLLPTPLLLTQPSPHVMARTHNAASSSVAHPTEYSTPSRLHLNDALSSTLISSSNDGSLLMTRDVDAAPAARTIDNQMLQTLSRYKARADTVTRVIDSSTVQLTTLGYVKLDTVRGAGTTFVMPECLDKAPSYKLKGLLSKGTAVKVYDLTTNTDNKAGESSDAGPKRVWIVRSSDELIVNRELVRSGFAFVRKGGYTSNTNIPQEVVQELNQLEMNARRDGLGIFKICNSNLNSDTDLQQSTQNSDNSASASDFFVAEFEPLEYTTQTKWSDDGGTTVVLPKQSPSSNNNPPNNPGDIKGCSDFQTFEDALGYYEMYYPYYGDVAKLDRRGNGVPCSGLPHTKNMDRYRMKRPNNVK
jgi:endonuclease YncB( thermonuclease family)